MKDKIESFLKKRVADLQNKKNEYHGLVLDDNFFYGQYQTTIAMVILFSSYL